MASCIDRLEENLKRQIDVLDQICMSDSRFAEGSETLKTDMSGYDSYLKEQDSFISILDELDSESDELMAYLADHPEEISAVGTERRKCLTALAGEIENKLNLVAEAEREARALVDDHLRSNKDRLASSRKTARVIQNGYRPNSGVAAEDNKIFDIFN